MCTHKGPADYAFEYKGLAVDEMVKRELLD